MGFDLSHLESIKVLVAPLTTFSMGLFGFIVSTLARRKRFSNERISTLKDIQALPSSISDDLSIKKRVEKEMRSAVLYDLTGIPEFEEAEKFIKITSLISLTEKHKNLLKKSLFATSFSIKTLKKTSKQQHIKALQVKIHIPTIRYHARFKATLYSILFISLVITQLNTIQAMPQLNTFVLVVMIIASFFCGFLLSSYVWPWDVKSVQLMMHTINKQLRQESLNENNKIMRFIE